MRCSLRRGARHKRSAEQTLNLEGSPSGGDNSQNLLPTGALLLPMSPVHSVTHVSGPDPGFLVGLGGLEPPTSRLSELRSLVPREGLATSLSLSLDG